MSENICPFIYEECLEERCAIFVTSRYDKFVGCGVNIISKNLVDVKMMLKKLLEHFIKIED